LASKLRVFKEDLKKWNNVFFGDVGILKKKMLLIEIQFLKGRKSGPHLWRIEQGELVLWQS